MIYAVVGVVLFFFFFQAEDGIRDGRVTGVQTCALPIWTSHPVVEDLLGHAAERLEGGDVAAEHGGEVLLSNEAGPHHSARSEERRVGKECRSRWSPDH